MRSFTPLAVLFALAAPALADPAGLAEHQHVPTQAEVEHRATHDLWINQGNYKSPADGSHCCGENDCFMLAPDAVTWTPAGWRIEATGETIPEAETQLSEDGEFWRCKRHDGSRRCFFAPGMGS